MHLKKKSGILFMETVLQMHIEGKNVCQKQLRSMPEVQV